MLEVAGLAIAMTTAPGAHADVMVHGDITFCVPVDATASNPETPRQALKR